MKVKWNTWLTTGALMAIMLAAAGRTAARYRPPKKKHPPPTNNQNPPATSTDKSKANNSLTLDDPNAAPVNAEEDAAFKAISDVPSTDQEKRIELGEAFLQKYPTSRYRSPVYGTLVMSYVQSGQVQKMEEAADKELALNPNDVQVLAVVGQTLPRAMNSKTPEPDKVLAKAEDYSKKAIELTPTIRSE